MKIIEHGVYYEHKVDVLCDKCNCHYSVDNVFDTHVYDKPVKVEILGVGDLWREKRYYYTECPECKHKNPMTNREYDIVTTRIEVRE